MALGKFLFFFSSTDLHRIAQLETTIDNCQFKQAHRYRRCRCCLQTLHVISNPWEMSFYVPLLLPLIIPTPNIFGRDSFFRSICLPLSLCDFEIVLFTCSASKFVYLFIDSQYLLNRRFTHMQTSWRRWHIARGIQLNFIWSTARHLCLIEMLTTRSGLWANIDFLMRIYHIIGMFDNSLCSTWRIGLSESLKVLSSIQCPVYSDSWSFRSGVTFEI